MTGPHVSLEQARRQAHSAMRGLVDQTTDLFAQVPGSYPVVATIDSITAGAASDGNAVITVNFRNGTTTAAGWNAAQTFAVGQRVLCHLVEGQLLVAFPIVGQP